MYSHKNEVFGMTGYGKGFVIEILRTNHSKQMWTRYLDFIKHDDRKRMDILIEILKYFKYDM